MIVEPIYYQNNLVTCDISSLIKKNSNFGSEYWDSFSTQTKVHSLLCGATFQFVRAINQIWAHADLDVKKFQEKIWCFHFYIVWSVWTHTCEWVFIYRDTIQIVYYFPVIEELRLYLQCTVFLSITITFYLYQIPVFP